MATIEKDLTCFPSNDPSDVQFTMHVGDTLQFLDPDGVCVLYYSPPEGFTTVDVDGGWGFVATEGNVKYPYAYFMFAGVEGRFTTYSVVVYNP